MTEKKYIVTSSDSKIGTGEFRTQLVSSAGKAFGVTADGTVGLITNVLKTDNVTVEVNTDSKIAVKSGVFLETQCTASEDGYILKVDSTDHKIKPMAGSAASVTFADITGQPADNTALNTILTNKMDKSAINDSSTVSETNLWSSQYVNQKINAIASITSIQVVPALPTSPVNNTMYYVGTSSPYHIYFRVNDYTYDFGTTEMDLTDYIKKTGGTLSGTLNTTTPNVIQPTSSTSSVKICGDNLSSGTYLEMQGIDGGGQFIVKCRDDENSKVYTFKPSGQITCGSSTIETVQAIFDMLYPIGSYAFGVHPTLGTWTQVEGDCALWIKKGSADGTILAEGLPIPTISSLFSGTGTISGKGSAHTHTFTGSSATTGNQSANHTHTFTGTSVTTSSNGAHTHTEKYGAAWKEGSDPQIPAYRDTTNSKTYSCDSAGAHTHTVTAAGTNSTQSASHTHNVTAKGSNSSESAHTHTVTATGTVSSMVVPDEIYGVTEHIQPKSRVITVWKRTA